MNSDQSKDRSIPFIIIVTTIIAYGLLLPKTGFYWDDWPFAWIARFLGPGEFIPAFDGVRPFLGPIFQLTTSLVPPVPVYWQIFALLIRIIAGLSAWFAFRQIWPQHKQQMLVASLLFLLFPGYSQHWVAFTHINQEWIPLIFYLLSFGFTAYALRHPSSFYRSTGIALLLLVPGVFPTEYFASIEPLRIFFIWAILSEQMDDLRQRIIKSVKLWLPYFLVWIANALWLAYFYTLGNYGSYGVQVAEEPLSVLKMLRMSVDTLWKVGFYIWGQIVLLLGRSITTPSSLLTLVLIVAAFVFFVFYLFRFQSNSSSPKSLAGVAVLTGLSGILLGRLPSFAAGLSLTLQSSFDRFMISMMIGGSLFIIGIVELLVRNSRAKTYVFALLIAFAVGQQFFNANIFRRDWERQQEIFWQLAWRIPALEPGTALLTDQLPLDYETDLSFTAPLNWMYAPDYTRSDLPYAWVYTDTRLGKASLPSLAPQTDIFIGMRAANFNGSTSQVIVIYKPQSGCLRVLSPDFGDQITYAGESPFLLDAIPLSNLDLIDVDSTWTPRLPFLTEPEHTWCYYFARAELARQKGDWQEVVNLHNEATSLGYRPGDPFEWLVFIEGQAMTGNLAGAQELSDRAITDDTRVRRGVCQVWERVQAAVPARSEIRSSADANLMNFECLR